MILHPQNPSLTFWDLVNRLVPMLPGPAVPGFKQLRWLHLPRSVCQHYPMSTWLKYACNQVMGVSVEAWGKWVSVSCSGKTIRFVCSFVLYFSFAYHTVLFPNERNVISCIWEIFSFPNVCLLAVILYLLHLLSSLQGGRLLVSPDLLSRSLVPCRGLEENELRESFLLVSSILDCLRELLFTNYCLLSALFSLSLLVSFPFHWPQLLLNLRFSQFSSPCSSWQKYSTIVILM